MNLFAQKKVKFIVLLLFIFCIQTNISDAKNIPERLSKKQIYVNAIRSEFVKEVEKEFDIRAIGLGGSINSKVNEITIKFCCDQQVNVSEARWLFVYLKQKLADKVNQHEKIRPFLEEYPFPQTRANISLSFEENSDQKIKNVEFVHIGKGKVFYCKRLHSEGFEYEDLLVETFEETLKAYKVEDKPMIFKTKSLNVKHISGLSIEQALEDDIKELKQKYNFIFQNK